jgi:N-acetylneuraminic acid mutarotase
VDDNSYPPRDGHCACSCHGKVYIFGGVTQANGHGEHQETNDLLAFDSGICMVQ